MHMALRNVQNRTGIIITLTSIDPESKLLKSLTHMPVDKTFSNFA